VIRRLAGNQISTPPSRPDPQHTRQHHPDGLRKQSARATSEPAR
jgi:hypothetical protein